MVHHFWLNNKLPGWKPNRGASFLQAMCAVRAYGSANTVNTPPNCVYLLKAL